MAWRARKGEEDLLFEWLGELEKEKKIFSLNEFNPKVLFIVGRKTLFTSLRGHRKHQDSGMSAWMLL